MTPKDWNKNEAMIEAAKMEILAALKNGVVAKSVKQMQFGKVNAGTMTTSTTSSFRIDTNSTYNLSAYLDISISEVDDISKCEINVDNSTNGNAYKYIGELTSKTNLRVYTGHANKAEPIIIANGFIWEVKEFY